MWFAQSKVLTFPVKKRILHMSGELNTYVDTTLVTVDGELFLYFTVH